MFCGKCDGCGAEIPVPHPRSALCVECAWAYGADLARRLWAANALCIGSLFLRQAHEAGAHSVVWEFSGAPQALKLLSDNGGDEDWLVVVFSASEWAPRWIEELGCYSVQEHRLPCGVTVFIGSHA